MSQEVNNLIGAVGDVIKTAPTFYEDALQPTVQETGKILALIPQTIESALLPLRKWNIEREYKFAETKKLLEHKLQNVDPDKIVTPEAYVAVPAIQAISYSMNSKELRNLYANLLAKAMNSDTQDLVHPSFVEIIKQMSPIDALVFKTIMEREVNPVIDLVYERSQKGYLLTINTQNVVLATNISDIDIAPIETICFSIDNLVKQNLIFVPNDSNYAKEELYDSILKSSYYIRQQHNHPQTPDGFVFSYKKKMITKTNLGIQFYDICVMDL